MELIKATKVWLRMNDAMASLPAAIAVRATRGRISVFKGADAAGDNDLIASIITKGPHPCPTARPMGRVGQRPSPY